MEVIQGNLNLSLVLSINEIHSQEELLAFRITTLLVNKNEGGGRTIFVTHPLTTTKVKRKMKQKRLRTILTEFW